MKLFITILTFLISISGLMAQVTMTLDDIFKIALENNHQLKILENQQEIAENSANIGNAGLLPNVTLNGSYGANVTDTELEFAGNIPPTNQDGARSSNLSGSANVNYVIFNGLNAQRTYQRLQLNALAMDAQSRAQVESTLLQVANSYYILARANEQVEIAQANVEVSDQRYQRAKIANELGTSLRTELLSARVDLTSDSSALLDAQLQRDNAQRNLERLIGKNLNEFVTTEEIKPEVRDWTAEQLFASAQENNAGLKNAELQIALAEKDYQISWASAFPQLSLSGGYSYNNQQSEAGIVLSNIQNGWNGQVALSYPIFTGFRNRTQRQNQQIAMENSELQKQDQELQLATDINNAFATYKQSLKVYQFEEGNLASAELNLERSEELFKAGQITSTQFREAQLALAAAKQRLNNARISVKLNELEIMRLTGQILNAQN